MVTGSKEAYRHPEFDYVTYSPAWDVAKFVEEAILAYVLEGRYEFSPRKFHNTEIIQCLIRSGYERHMSYTPELFTDVNLLFIGESVHEKMATIIPNTLAEEEFTDDNFDEDLTKRLKDRPDPIELSFHIDVHHPHVAPGTSVVYEIKTKETLKGLYDQHLLKSINIYNQKETQVTPTASYLNQLVPYEVVTNSERGVLIYIPKMMFKDILSYEVVLPSQEGRRHVQEVLTKRAEVLAAVMSQFENKEPLNLSIIEPSGICKTYCQFGRPKTVYEVPEKNISQQCPVYLLPTPTKITKAPIEIQDFYQHLVEAVEAKFEAAGFVFTLHFQYALEKRPELITIPAKEFENVVGMSFEEAEDFYLTNLEKWQYIQVRADKSVTVIPIRSTVRRGWGQYIFAPHYPAIKEANDPISVKLEDHMIEIVNKFIWLPYDFKGLFGCPRLQHFGNRGETKSGLEANRGQAKLWFIDMAIFENLVANCCDPTMETAKFANYTFRYYRLLPELVPGSDEKRAVLWIPIFRTEWREISGRRRIPKNPVILPLEKHIRQAALLSLILGIKNKVRQLMQRKKDPLSREEATNKVKASISKGKYPEPEPVFLGYYPRKAHGEVRMYEVVANDPVALTALGTDFIKLVEQSEPIANYYRAEIEAEITRVSKEQGISGTQAILYVKKQIADRYFLQAFTCRWCPKRPWCDEGRNLLNWLDLSLEDTEASGSDMALRTF